MSGTNRRRKDSDNYSEFYKAYEEMNRAENKRQRKIERHEKSFGHDEIIWEQVDDKGVLLHTGDEWFIELPHDTLMDRIYQAQNQLFSIMAKMKDMDRSSTEYKRLKEKLAAKNEYIEYLHSLFSSQ